MTIPSRNQKDVQQERDKSLANGFLPIPIKRAIERDKATGKAPLWGEGKWQEKARARMPIQYDSMAQNTGIMCDRLAVFDIDVDESKSDALDQTAAIYEHMVSVAGEPKLCRYRDGSDRMLVVYRVADGERVQKKVKVSQTAIETNPETGREKEVYKGHALEVLATGQQFVAFGYHFSGQELKWSGDTSPATISLQDLTTITEDQIYQITDKFRELVDGKYAAVGVRDEKADSKATHASSAKAVVSATTCTSLTPSPRYHAVTKNDLEDAVNQLPGESDRDKWAYTLAAIYRTGKENGDYPTKEFARQWSMKDGSYTEAGFDATWRSIENGQGATRDHNFGMIRNLVREVNPKYFTLSETAAHKERCKAIRFKDVTMPKGYFMNGFGLHFQPETKGSEEARAIHITSYFEIVGETTTEQGSGNGVLVKFHNRNAESIEMIGKAELLESDNGFCKRLMDKGLTIELDQVKHLKTFFNKVKAPYLTHTDKAGWHGNSFLLADGSQFNSDGLSSPVIMNPTAITRQSGLYAASGSLEGWQEGVAALASGNPSLVFQISGMFAGPLLGLMNVASGGFHFYGESSRGKSTALQVAASVFGRPNATGQIKSWRATDNSLESIAEQLNDQTLCLDEISQCDNSKVIGQAVYMLANGSGKARANQRGDARPVKTFNLLYFSNGERTLENMMDAENRGQIQNAGIGVRMVNIPIDEISRHFDTHEYANMAEFMISFKSRVMENHGWAGKRFLEELVRLRATEEDQLKEIVKAYIAEFMKNNPSDSDPQVGRICERFAIVAAAGELATELGVLPWKFGEASAMAKICFNAAIAVRSAGIGGDEDHKAVELVRQHLQMHGAKFKRIGCDYPPNECHGLYDDRYFYFYPAGFKVACKGMNETSVAKILYEHGYLKRQVGDRYTMVGGKDELRGKRFYHVTKEIFDETD